MDSTVIPAAPGPQTFASLVNGYHSEAEWHTANYNAQHPLRYRPPISMTTDIKKASKLLNDVLITQVPGVCLALQRYSTCVFFIKIEL